MMKCVSLVVLLFALFLAPYTSVGLETPEPDLAELLEQRSLSASEQLNTLLQRVRDNRITREAARSRLMKLIPEAKDEYYRAGGRNTDTSAWYFPVAGRSVKAITGGLRHGYSAGGYDFYRGNRHGGHPSLDIFIRDRNQDGLDDLSGKPVQVLSITSGIVVAAEENWESGSRLRGGKYIWIYDPANDLLLYYAHNEKLLVTVGDLVSPGKPIATVGRSGFNAAKRRSPTHLHLTALTLKGGRMLPVDLYSNLKTSVTTTAN